MFDHMSFPAALLGGQTERLPQPSRMAAQAGALATLDEALRGLQRHLAGEAVEPVDLGRLDEADLAVVEQVLGEGDVVAHADGDDGVQARESVFAGVWRVCHRQGREAVRDTIEVGAFPRAIAAVARGEAQPMRPLPGEPPADAPHAPAVLEGLRRQSQAWLKGRRPPNGGQVFNLSVLPLTAGDSQLFEQWLGRGRVTVRSRGHGSCRAVNTRVCGVWRITYSNSQDRPILDLLEVGDVPEVACAARRDFEDSAERLAELLRWIEAA
jgi:hydrogenase-1 operon protein HyaF